ncbi:hypothetical protein Nepgr_010757 [Nepenthes gracilis]|uniref:BHLH domain-containing protein n=1 Tax=Nepenthes gracilis TaxID=150966 RepID=A0AAD3SD86_NEPGR|nr:hypothetical protein Nepgr_010757 [Nepenthes gracilis]
MADSLACFFKDSEFGESNLAMASSPEDLFSIFDALEGVSEAPTDTPSKLADDWFLGLDKEDEVERLVFEELEAELEDDSSSSPKRKRPKLMVDGSNNPTDGLQRMSHITVERNRRKQMNENLSVLRSLMPSFYVKRGDQASIIGGVVEYINELQQVLQSLESKKQRKAYSEVLSPKLVLSPRPAALSPRRSPLSPRVTLPISPRTPQPSSPYRPRLQQGGGYLSPSKAVAVAALELSPSSSTASSVDNANSDLVANSKSPVAEVEVKFSGANVLLNTLSPRIPGQVVKIISALEGVSLEVLHLNINSVDETMLHSFTIKIGIECRLSAEELAQQIQQTFC